MVTSLNGVAYMGQHSSSPTIEIGSTVEGVVIKLADYGVIVRLAGGRIGLVHISEIAETYVRDIREHFKENDRICVKILKLNDKGRFELSVKQADQKSVPKPRTKVPRREHPLSNNAYINDKRQDPNIPLTFEDKLSRFLKESEEKQVDIKRSVESKRGGGRRK